MDDRFRFCIYCQADVLVALPMHREDCPELTGIYPVLKQDLEPHGLRCFDCHEEFAEGDFYVERPFGKEEQELADLQRSLGFGGLKGVVSVCTGCGALDAMTA